MRNLLPLKSGSGNGRRSSPAGRFVGATLLCMAAALMPALAQDGETADPAHWEGFQGNAGHTGFIATLAPTAYQPLWVARPEPSTAAGRATAVVWNGKLVISDISPSTIPACDRVEDSAILAYDPQDGSQVWRVPTGGKLVGAPHVSGNLVFAVVWDCPPSGNYADNSTLYAIDSRDGRVVWQQALEGTEAGPPVVAEGLVIVPGRKRQALLAYDALSGALRWQAPLLDASSNTVQAAAVLDGSVFAVDGKHLYAFDLATGSERWRADTDGKGNPWRRFDGVPIAADGLIMVVGQSNLPGPKSRFSFEAYDAATGAFVSGLSLGENDWANAGWSASYHGGRAFISAAWLDAAGAFQRGLIAFDVMAASEAWRIALDAEVYPPAIDGAGDLLVAGTLWGFWLLDAQTGSILWESDATHHARPWRNVGKDGQPLPGMPTRDEWLPGRWASDVDGSPLLLDSLGNLGEFRPVLAGGLTFGKGGNAEPYLVAYAADTTPPSAEIRRPPGGFATLRREFVYGTAYDYNLKSWKLEYGSGADPQSWITLKESTKPEQGHADMINGLGPWDARELESGIWTLRLTVTDAAGLTSTATTQVKNDLGPPSVEIEWPRDGMTLDSAEIRVTGIASDDFELKQVTVAAPSGATRMPAEGLEQWSFDFTASNRQAGEWIVIEAIAEDMNGHVARDEVRVRLAPLQVQLGDQGRKLTSNYPIFVPPTLGRDYDGVLDAWEEAVIPLVEAIIEVDEEEDWLRNRTGEPVAQFARVRTYELAPPPLALPTDGCGEAQYLVTIDTSDIEYAGTDANVFLNLVDAGGCQTGSIFLDNPEENFEAGSSDTFLVTAPNIAAFERLMLSHDNAGDRPGWHVSWIHVENLTESWEVSFSPGLWLENERLCWASAGTCTGFYEETPLDPQADLLADPPDYVVFQYVLRWAMDYGRFGIEAHDIDTEKYFMAWKVVDTRTLELAYVFTSSHRSPNAHHSVWPAWDPACNVTDVANIWNEDEWRFEEYDHSEVICGALEFTPEGRLVLYPSEDKHALYPSEATCESVSLVTNPGPNAGEDCGWQPSSNPLSDSHWEDTDFASDPRYLMSGRWLLDVANTGDEPYILVSEGELAGLPVPLGALENSDDNPPQKLRRAMASRYRIEIQTGATNAGAALGWIDLQVGGVRGNSGSLALYAMEEPPRHAIFAGRFDDGSTDIFYAIDEDLGSLLSLTLTVHSFELTEAWQPHWVRITEIDSGQSWYFSGVGWLPGSPQGTMTVLYPGDAPQGSQYRVSILTGNRRDAGTDAAVTLNLIGTDGQESGPLLLDAPEENDFERNSMGVFTVRAPLDIAELGSIVLTQDNSGDQPGWYVRELRIRHLGTGRDWVFYAERWLANDEPGGRSAELLPAADCGQASYRIKVFTSGIAKAGTDAEVFVNLFDTGGACQTGEIFLDGAADNFEAGHAETFLVQAPNVASLERLQLRHDNSGDDAGWHVSSIVVENLTADWRVVFNPNAWLEGSQPCWASDGACQ